MNFVNLIGIGIGLSMDAFAVSLCKGLCQRTMQWKNAFIIGLSFGFFQAAMPLIGFFLGYQFSGFVNGIGHWIAFILLAFIGVHMIRESGEIKSDEEVCCDIKGELKLDLKNILALSIATSIDALAIGISFALLEINIFSAISVIGIITFAISIVGVFFGFKFGSKFKSKSEILGGLILIIIGLKILIEGIL
ncbi:manganese efflux pump MntP family protein [Peptostreptococcus canis]|uniref:Putative manganese efflux pump MntP n=1 Tax=Peptostreptococcus canis TaxID=1159213 RepID=A0ABR6TIF5_9FIRM|nr:manganese efflux pump MntP family protein [Peptostreptococcus canis]MBC2575180.1 manganese efflux pump [Peptostreptococcus canis]MBP1997645.1 putative Mn2+ efflux pump MntP [Peptostreptococcus canis]